MTNSPYKGVFAAVLTPVKADMSVDLDLMAAHSKWLLANGCDGLGVLGTTGEANSYSLKERIEIIQGLVERGVPGDVMMPGTGCCSTAESVELTKVAMEAGAKGVLMLPPFYYKNNKDEGLFAAFSEVIQKIGDDKLKIHLYHFPQMSGVPLSYNLIEMLLKAYPQTVVGMKDSSGDLENMAGAAERFPGFSVFAGADQLMLPTMRRGGVGCITAAANVSCALNAEVYKEYTENGEGPALEEKQARLAAMREAVSVFPYPPGLKALVGRNVGNDAWFAVRPPLVALTAAERQKLYDGFDALGTPMPQAA